MHFGVKGEKKRPEKDAVILKEHFKKKKSQSHTARCYLHHPPPHPPAVNKLAFKLGRFQAHHFHALSISPPVTGDSGIPGAGPPPCGPTLFICL